MAHTQTTDDDVQAPTRIDVERAIQDHAVELAEAEQNASPGTTRVSLLVRRDGDGVSARVRTDNDNAVPIPALAENEVYLWKIAGVSEWHDSSHREWWLSGKGVEKDGFGFFEYLQEGPAKAGEPGAEAIGQ